MSKMLNVESLQVAEEEVVESSPNKLGDVYNYVAEGIFSPSISPLKKKNIRRYAQKFIIEEGKLYYVGPNKEEKREVVIETERKRQIFLDCHLNDIGNHLGQKKTVNKIQSKFYWLGIIKDVVEWIKVCETCQHAERSKTITRTGQPLKIDGPWVVVGIDILGPFPETRKGKKCATLIIDYFSKWPEADPLRKTDALSVAKCISDSIYRFGAPKALVCTQSPDFCNEVSKILYDTWRIGQTVSPLDQGLEQLKLLHNSSSSHLKEAIEQMVSEKQSEWDKFLDPLLFSFRTTTNPTTKFTPHMLMYNREANLHKEVKFCYKQEKRKKIEGHKSCPQLSI